ncbi:Monooxygenase [Paramixta manurensis]|uniref:Monooxygenase n=1 Tax=Paramixta manurensis TaxID=2740817 RepID=A0A6M8U809_9GAMM|nr:Monooxygenase [Erwiniaceae bacterium PD-1]
MTQRYTAWGQGPDDNYAELAARFRPLFERIRADAEQRENSRELLFEAISWLKQARFGALRLPVAEGGFGASLPTLFSLLIELAAADSNVAQALRAHFGFVDNLLLSPDRQRQGRWFPRIARGDLVGNAWSEIGDARQGQFSTRVTINAGRATLRGEKYYTTGSLYADWINTGASGEDNQSLNVVVARTAPGVEVVDDWNGFGQRLTASGSARFVDAPVDIEDVIINTAQTSSEPAFYQLVHLATLAGIGRAAAEDVALAVRQRQRSYSHATSPLPANDAQILQIVGQVHGAAYAAGAVVLQGARALERAFDLRHQAELGDEANAQAELEIAQSQTVVSDLILNAVTILFDALGASATVRERALDRYWRNARTLTSHNPRVYKDRIVGDYAVNGTAPGYQWRIGKA